MEVGLMQLALAVISGGLIQAFLSFLIRKRETNRGDFAQIVNTWKEDNLRLREENELLRRTLNDHESKIRALQYQVTMLESAHQDLPVPMWLKDLEGNMLSLNKEYEKVFLEPLGKTIDDYIGRKDVDIWPKEVAEKFRNNDEAVLREQGPIHFTDENIGYKIIKFPRYASGAIVGIAGIAIMDDN